MQSAVETAAAASSEEQFAITAVLQLLGDTQPSVWQRLRVNMRDALNKRRLRSKCAFVGPQRKTFCGLFATVCDVQFNRHANFIVSGSKEVTIRLWDTSIPTACNGYSLLSGLRIQQSVCVTYVTSVGMPGTAATYSTSATLAQAEISTVDAVHFLEVATQSNDHFRAQGPPITAKNIVQASFGPRESSVFGRSEDIRLGGGDRKISGAARRSPWRDL
ncbi:hypothetical protein DD237_005714 [Peronospora effusa]|uniref:ASCH domain-containing protein n=1 Tax=Peronospora effusa TaxID=542832 RepID=A0A3R7Y582_9STRA|nr:hypothetical protein DD237_005714 [Peronospora effusa]